MYKEARKVWMQSNMCKTTQMQTLWMLWWMWLNISSVALLSGFSFLNLGKYHLCDKFVSIVRSVNTKITDKQYIFTI